MINKSRLFKSLTTPNIDSVEYFQSINKYENQNVLASKPIQKGRVNYDVFISSDLAVNSSYSLTSTEDKNRTANMRLAGKFSIK